MKYRKIFLFFIFFTLSFKSVISQKLVIDIKPENQFKKLTNYKSEPKEGFSLDWMPDRKAIIYGMERLVRKYELETGNDMAISGYPGKILHEVRISPSGRMIAYLMEDEPPYWEEERYRYKIIIDSLEKDIKKIKIPFEYPYEIFSFIWSLDGKKLIIPFAYGESEVGVFVYDILGKKLKKLKGLVPASHIAVNYKNIKFYTLDSFLIDPTQNKPIEKIKINVKKWVIEWWSVEDIDCKGENLLITAYLSNSLAKKHGFPIGYAKQIFRYNLKEDTLYLLTKEKKGTSIKDVRYSPDCKKIAFFSNRNGFWNLWLLDLEEKK